jgi:hypothetical protein
VQRWFDQGLMLTYGFNHDAAERSFLKATELDPDVRDVLVGRRAGARAARQQPAWTRRTTTGLARLQRPSRSRRASAARARVHRRAVRALRAGPARRPPPLDEAYARRPAKLVKQRPDDLDAAVLHAEALMDLQPWDYYDEKAGRRATPRDRRDARVGDGAQSGPRRRAAPVRACGGGLRDPQRGVAAADRLRTLIPARATWCTCRRTSTRASAAGTTR